MNQRIRHKINQYKKMAEGHNGNTVPKKAVESSTDSLLQVIRSKKDADDFMAELDSIIKRAK
jgi:hypothetical protein